MSRYDGLIIPRSYSEYINKTDAATLLQALQLSGVMDNAPTANSNHPVKSNGIYTAIEAKNPVDTVTENNQHAVTSNAVANAIGKSETVIQETGLTILGIKNKLGTYLNIHLVTYKTLQTITYLQTVLFTLPSGWRPTDTVRITAFISTQNDRIAIGIDIDKNGQALCYPLSKGILDGSVNSQGIYGDIFVRIL